MHSDGVPFVANYTLAAQSKEYAIIPEFPTWTSMLLVPIILTVTIAFYKRRLPKTPTL